LFPCGVFFAFFAFAFSFGALRAAPQLRLAAQALPPMRGGTYFFFCSGKRKVGKKKGR